MNSSSTVSTQSRRSFFKMTAAGAAMAIPSFASMNGSRLRRTEALTQRQRCSRIAVPRSG